jgi:hypothetical protein
MESIPGAPENVYKFGLLVMRKLFLIFSPLLFAGRETAVLKHPPPLLHLQQGAEGALRTPLTRHHLTQQLSHPLASTQLLVDIKLPTYGTREEQLLLCNLL